MAMPKDTLTTAQIKYVEGIIRGKTQIHSYNEAFPKSQKWTDRSTSSAATSLFAQQKIQKFYTERVEQTKNLEAEKTTWTRYRAIEMLTELANKAQIELQEGKLTMSRILAIQSSVKELNLMHGYNQTNVNNNNLVQVVFADNELED